MQFLLFRRWLFLIPRHSVIGSLDHLDQEQCSQKEIPGNGAEKSHPFQKRAFLSAKQQADPKEQGDANHCNIEPFHQGIIEETLVEYGKE
jgi:hypothetical protein